MAIIDTLNSIKTHIEDAYGMAEEKGATIPDNKNLENLANTIESISGGGETPIITDCYEFFYQARRLDNLDIFKILKPIDASYMFNGMPSPTHNLPDQVNDIDFSNTTTTDSMFYSSYIKNNLWSTTPFTFKPNFSSKLKTMEKMFNTADWINLDFSNCDLSGVTNINYMFTASPKIANRPLTVLDLSTLIFTNKVSMSGTFSAPSSTYDCMSGIKFNEDNIIKVSTMYRTFYQRTKMTKCNIEQLDTSECTSFEGTFYQLKSLTTTDNEEFNINSLDISKGTTFLNCFYQCTNLVRANLSNWAKTLSSTNSVSGMFNGCSKLELIDVRNMGFTAITNSSYYSNMLNGVPTTVEIIVKDDANKQWFNNYFTSYTNVKTVDELGE